MGKLEPKDETSKNVEAQLSVLLAEYGALKSEQLGRIGFRDNLLYVTVGAVGAIGAVALGGVGEAKKEMVEAFLLVPWVTTILGWTYLVNDEKITAIREYVETKLAGRIDDLIAAGPPFEWEGFHRADLPRGRRKAIQLAIDIITFVVSGAGALAFYWTHDKKAEWQPRVLVGVEALLLLFLAGLFVAHHARASAKPSATDRRDRSA